MKTSLEGIFDTDQLERSLNGTDPVIIDKRITPRAITQIQAQISLFYLSLKWKILASTKNGAGHIPNNGVPFLLESYFIHFLQYSS